MASSTTPTRLTSAGLTSSGACTNGSTARRWDARTRACGGAATTSTTTPGTDFQTAVVHAEAGALSWLTGSGRSSVVAVPESVRISPATAGGSAWKPDLPGYPI